MKLASRFLATTFSTLTLFALAGTAASAQCGGPSKVSYSGHLRTGVPAHLRLASWPEDERDEFGMEPIVGLWHVDMEDTSKGYADKGYQAWHGDHTEFFNSTRAPGTGAVCQGVWQKVGRSTFQLNHFALAYNGTVGPLAQGGTGSNETAPAQLVHIRETVTVDGSRKHFQGTFTVDVYSYAGHNLLVSFKGPITADRVTIDSPVSSQ